MREQQPGIQTWRPRRPALSYKRNRHTGGAAWPGVAILLAMGFALLTFGCPQAASVSAPTSLAQPVDFAIVRQDGGVTLRWNPVAGAISYNVYRALSEDSLVGVNVTNVRTTFYSETDLDNGQNYYYWVTAVNADNEGPLSETRTAVPAATAAVPAQANDLVATVENGGILLTWRAVDTATYYSVYRALSEDSLGDVTAIGVITNRHREIDLDNGIEYFYQVVASNDAGPGLRSGVVSATFVE